jgi:hypothetical protein
MTSFAAGCCFWHPFRFQLALKMNAKEISHLIRLPPVLVSTADMLIKADVPSLHLRVDEVVDLAVPLALRPKKAWIGKAALATQPVDRQVEPAPSSSVSSALPRKESRKNMEIKSAPASKGSTSTESPTNPSGKTFGPSAVPAAQSPADGRTLGTKVLTGIAGSVERTRIRLPSLGRMPVVAESAESKSVQAESGERKVASPPSRPSLDAADRSIESVLSGGVTSDLAVPHAVFRQHVVALDRLAVETPPIASVVEPGLTSASVATFQHAMTRIEEQLRVLSSMATSARTPDAALKLAAMLCESGEVLANAVAACRERALHVASQNFEEIDLMSRNNAMLVQALAESQAAEMTATMLVLHGSVSKP